MFSFIRPYRKRLILVAFLYLLASAATLLMPMQMSRMVTDGIENGNAKALWVSAALMLLMALAAFVSRLISSRADAQISTGFAADVSKALFRKINSLSFDRFAAIGSSSLLTRLTDDLFEMREAVVALSYTVVTVPCMLIGGLLLSLFADATLSLVFLCAIPPILLVVYFVIKPLNKLWEQSDRYIDLQNRLVRERLSGLRVIRAFNKEPREHERIKTATETMAHYIITANVRACFVEPVALLLLNFATVAMVWFGAKRVSLGVGTSAGDVIACIQYVALIGEAVITLSWTMSWIPHLKVAFGRVAEVLNDPGAAALPAVTGDDTPRHGDLVFSHVTFSYPEASAPALSDVSFTIEEGKTTAIIGGTGSGKTTLSKLFLGFYLPTEGNISIGGEDYLTLSDATVKNSFSIALQKSMIFEGSIRENITMGKKDASDEEIREVLSIAEMADFVDSHPEGLDYLFSSSGANISGGQKQRVNIARSIIRPASFYLFDDSFSALDYLTEYRLRQKLNRYLAGKTQIIITQRVATAMRCDTVLVFDGGRLVGSGDSKTLYETCSVYREIYDSQLGGDRALSAKGGDLLDR